MISNLSEKNQDKNQRRSSPDRTKGPHHTPYAMTTIEPFFSIKSFRDRNPVGMAEAGERKQNPKPMQSINRKAKVF